MLAPLRQNQGSKVFEECRGGAIYMIAGDDDEGDCHVVFTDSPLRAIGHHKFMVARFEDKRCNQNFGLLRPLIADFDADTIEFPELPAADVK